MTEMKKLQNQPTYLHNRKFSQSVFPRFSVLVRPLRNLTEFNCPAIRAGAEKCQTIDPPEAWHSLKTPSLTLVTLMHR